MYTLVVHDDAKEDLRQLSLMRSPLAARKILVLLQEIQGDQTALDRLLDHDYGDERFHVSRVGSLWPDRNIWRLKFWDLQNVGLRYRIIYAYEIPQRRFHVLAVLPREWNYDLNDERTKRFIRAYDEDLR